MACPVLKTLSVSFTAPSPIPANGYRVKWRVVGTSTYTTAVGPFVSSPALVTNVPACENVEGTIEAVCGAVFSAVASFVAAKEETFVCGSSVSGTTSSSSFYIYPRKLVDLNGSADSITINYDVATLPNRINVYNSENALVVTSGWRGTAAYAGPWGATLSTASTGSINFLKSTAGGDQRWYTINAEHAGHASITDSWSATIACATTGGGGGTGGTTPTYAVSASPTTINEGATATFTVTTTNVANGTTLHWTTAGTAVAADFVDNTTFGTVVINNNTGTITRTATNDITTEGSETFTLSLRTGSSVGTVVATSQTVTINDTSLTPATTTIYNATRCDNGASGTIQYNGPNNLTAGVVVKNHLNVCYTIVSVNTGGTANAGYIVSEHSTCNDCTGGTGGTGGGSTTTYYTFNITAGYGSAADACLEGNGVTQIYGYNVAFLDNAVFYSNTALTTPYAGNNLFYKNTATNQWSKIDNTGNNVLEGSCADVGTGGTTGGTTGGGTTGGSTTPTYSMTPSANVVNEGGSFTFNITTTNVANGTVLYWVASGTNISGGDFADNLLSGTVTVNNNAATLTRNIAADLSTEGLENFTIDLKTGSTAGPTVATSSVSINDTSTASGGGMTGIECMCNGQMVFFQGRDTCIGACEEQTT